VARTRKRAKDRQRSRAGAAAAARRSATARAAGLEDDVPESIRHAAPDVELAEAQLALGRPDLADADPEAAETEPTFADAEDPESLDEEQFESLEDEVDETDDVQPRGRRPPRGAEQSDGAGALTTTGAHAPAQKVGTFSRLVNFLQGSWRELQRVQWPDRRQVIQATSVVIGFVIVAGAFLGIADLLATKLMKFILG
jgi:preprotein translocase subunit SecE